MRDRRAYSEPVARKRVAAMRRRFERLGGARPSSAPEPRVMDEPAPIVPDDDDRGEATEPAVSRWLPPELHDRDEPEAGSDEAPARWLPAALRDG